MESEAQKTSTDIVVLGPCLRASHNWTEMVADLMAAREKFAPLLKDNTATVPMKSGGKYSYQYADLASVLELALPPLREHGLQLIQAGDSNDGTFTLTTTLVHKSGAWLSNVFRIPCGRDAQAVGSAETYARRYALMALLSLAADDDDGKAATENAPKSTPKQESKPAQKSSGLGPWGQKVADLFDNAIKCPKNKRADLLDAATCGTHLMGDVKNEAKAQVIYGIFENIAKAIPYAEMMERLHDVRALGTDDSLGGVFDDSFSI